MFPLLMDRTTTVTTQTESGHKPQIDAIVAGLKYLSDIFPLYGPLVVLMMLDTLMGFCAASISQSVNSSACGKGMVKKVGILLLCAMCNVVEPYTSGIPITTLAAGAFILFECTSIVENAAACGIPIPPVVLSSLEMMRQAGKKAMTLPTQPTQQVTINRAQKVDVHTDATVVADPKTSDSVVLKASDLITPKGS